MSTFLITVGVGLVTAAILALSAIAFTLEYAVSRVANFAHGELLTIGAYAAYTGQNYFHQNVAAAALIAAAAGTLAGLALNTSVIEQFRGRSPTTVLIATLGVSLIVQNVLTRSTARPTSPIPSRRAACTTSGRSCGRRRTSR